ncbi:MAG: hypothetical protein IKF69_12465 [Exiguobacterium sp.]|nr:hypothetical protein [Exiguobacterium sp.]MBR3217212.1 hypothetical protein [Exiguobacterium sp.]
MNYSRMDLTTEEMLLVNSEVEKRKRSLLVAYLLWFSSVHLVRIVSNLMNYKIKCNT